MSYRDDMELLETSYRAGEYEKCLPLIEKLLAAPGTPDQDAARFLFRQGVCLGKLGKSAEEVQSYSTLWEKFKDSDIPDIQVQLAKAMFNKGVTFGEEGKADEVIQTCETLWEKFKDSDIPDIQVLLAKALSKKGFLLGQDGKTGEEIQTYKDIWAKFKDSEIPEIQIKLTQAMFNMAVTFGQDGKTGEAIQTYTTMCEKFKDSNNLDIQSIFANAMVNMGVTFGQNGKSDEEIQTYKNLLEKFKDSDIPDVQIQLAKAMVNMGVTFGKAGKIDEAVQTCTDMWEKFRDSKIPDIQIQLARAMVNMGVTFGQNGKADEEILAYSNMWRKFKDSDIPDIQVQLAKAMFYKGITFGQDGKTEEAVHAYKTLWEKFGASDNPDIQVLIAKAMVNKGVLLEKAGKNEEAIQSFSILFDRFSHSEIPEIQVQLARSLYQKCFLLGQDGKTGEEIQTYETLWEKFKNTDHREIKDIIGMALSNQIEIFNRKKDWAAIIKSGQSYLEMNHLPPSWDCLLKNNAESRANLLGALISIYRKCEEEIAKAQDEESSPKVCHFTDLKALYSMLELEAYRKSDSGEKNKGERKNYLRAYNAIYMNDPGEGRALIEYSHTIKTEKDKSIPDLTDFFKDGEHRWIEHETAKSVYSISFTAAADSLSLWRAYGRDGRGVCIVIPIETLKQQDGGTPTKSYLDTLQKLETTMSSAETPDAPGDEAGKSAGRAATDRDRADNLMPENLYRVKYISAAKLDHGGNEPAKAFLRKINGEIEKITVIKSKLTKDEAGSEIAGKINRAVREALAGVLYLFKDAQYEAEEEYRMITLRPISAPEICFDEQEVPRLYLKTRPFVFEDRQTEIILGPGIENPEFVELSIRRLIEVNRFAKDITVKRSEVQYRPKA